MFYISGQYYYLNIHTKESQWDIPEKPAEPAQSAGPDRVQCSHLLVKHKDSRRPSSWREDNITRSKDEALDFVKCGYKLFLTMLPLNYKYVVSHKHVILCLRYWQSGPKCNKQLLIFDILRVGFIMRPLMAAKTNRSMLTPTHICKSVRTCSWRHGDRIKALVSEYLPKVKFNWTFRAAISAMFVRLRALVLFSLNYYIFLQVFGIYKTSF